MNNILKSLTLAPLSILLLACGSGSSTDAPSAKITVESKKSSVSASKKNMSIELLLTNNYSQDVSVKVKDLSLYIPSCEIASNTFSPSEFSFDDKYTVKVSAKVIFAEACTPTSYKLYGTAVLGLDGNERDMPLNASIVKVDVSNPSTPSVPGSTIDSNSTGNTNTSINTEANLTLPVVVIPSALQEIKLSTNSKSIKIPIKVFKDISPYTEGSVKVELPIKVLDGVDVGLFDAYQVKVDAQGIATFNYTGPSNLQALLSTHDSSSTFKFYHVDNAKNKKELTVDYEIEEGSYVPIDYSLKITTQGDDFSMGLPNLQKTFTINLLDKDGNNIENKDVNFTKVEVSTENALIAQLLDNKTGEASNSVLLDNNNSSTFILNSKKLSGIAPIRVKVEFTDINNKVQKLSTIINVRVMSGPPSAISISYVGTGQDRERAKYQEDFAVSVTDEYGNKVNTKPYISLGAIVGYAVDGNEPSSKETNNTRRLYNAKYDDANGVIIPGATPSSTLFEETSVSSSVFKYVNSEGDNTDKLVVFGEGKNYEAMGKWDFEKLDDRTLGLQDDYFGERRENLYYAIGHNYYQDQCQEDGREWLGSTDSKTYQLDEEGTVVVSYKYDYHLTGKDALIWVNLNGYQADTDKNTRIGEVAKHTLRGKGLESRPTGGYFIDKNVSKQLTFNIHHENTNEWYRNGHFAYDIVANKCATVVEIDSINKHDARSCNNNGVAYVTFEVNATENESCNFNINNIIISSEF